MKFIVILGDGMSDYPVAQLDGRTPLQVAEKPNIDRIAREGRCGLLRTIEDDMAPGSEVANLSVLGYDPRKVLEGRGVLEAASMGVELSGEDVAMRCNLICVEHGRIKNHSAGHISSGEAAELISALQTELGDDELRFFAGVGYRHLMVGRGLDSRLICTPPHDHPGEGVAEHMIKPSTPEAESTARRLNEITRRSQEVLERHSINLARIKRGKDPANSIWLWSPGRKPKMWTFKERFDISGAVISAVDLVRGIGVYAGLEVIRIPGVTGLYDTNYEGKAEACLEAIERHDFCYVHVEAPDEAGHEGDLELKIKTIEDLDARLVRIVLDGVRRMPEPVVVAVLPDHPTPVEKRVHVRDPVPFAILDPGKQPDTVENFDESSCASGGLGLMHGDEFIRAVFGRH
ncbi:MAG: cofactor-independent phosphoglycerate mutase [Verrucomicrobia bacterium]|nr:cofactor-independent phosphoglycerate mutase [Verrucomicrobiota bacterium]